MIRVGLDIKVTPRPISIDKVLKSVGDKSAGAIVLFVGTVRNRSEGRPVASIDVESASDLAKRDLESIAKESMRRFEVSKLTVVHRVGRLKVGDAVVAIAVSAPHRKAAFAACRFVIDELKKTTPIWKKEYGPGSSQWVEG